MPALRLTHAVLPSRSKRTSRKLIPEDAAHAKALINLLMEDQLFLALYRSNDPEVRAAAMDKLNEAHHQAYGDPLTKGNDAASERQ